MAKDAQLEGRVRLFGNQRAPDRVEVHLDEDQPCLDPGDVEREHPGWTDAVRAPRMHEGVPEVDRLSALDPHLVAEVARIAGPGDVDGDAADLRCLPAEVLEAAQGHLGGRLEHVAAQRSLHGQRGDAFAHVLELDIQPASVHPEPAQRRVCGGPAVGLLL